MYIFEKIILKIQMYISENDTENISQKINLEKYYKNNAKKCIFQEIQMYRTYAPDLIEPLNWSWARKNIQSRSIGGQLGVLLRRLCSTDRSFAPPVVRVIKLRPCHVF